MPHRTLTRELLLRPGLFALTLVVVAVLGGILVGPAAATSQDMGARQALLPPSPAAGSPQLPVLPTRATQPGRAGDQPPDIPTGADVHLELAPADATIWLGDSKTYIATAIIQVGPYQAYAANNPDTSTESPNVTGWTDFSITRRGRPSGVCNGATCIPAKVGKHIVTGTFSPWPDHIIQAKAVLHVNPVEQLALEPPKATILQDDRQPYQAIGVAKDGSRHDVTAQTGFTITGPGPGECPRDQLGKVSCTASEIGDYTVTATLTQKGRDDLRATATLRVTDPVVSLRLDPTSAEIPVGTPQDYIAEGTTATNRKVDVTDQVALSIDPGGRCPEARCTPAEVGDHRVTGTLRQKGRDPITATAVLTVVPRPTTSTTTTTSETTTITSGTTTTSRTTTTTPASQPVISSVQPDFTFAGMSVEVGGNTGSCSRAGILTFHGNTGDVSVNVTADRQGNFVARVTIPKGTFPWAYQLELTVDCNGQLQRAQADLNVVNIAPTAAEDSARTIQDTPVSIPVTDNDRNPDPDTGYPTLVLVSSTPSHGTAEAQTDQSILYTPEQGFVGQDRFQYNLCDDILNVAGTADCSAATVTVTVIDAQACLPSPGNISSIKVNPSKGPGGMTLGITATVDRKLAACPFRLLLGGTPLGPDVQVGPDGSIATERGVPKDAKPGPGTIRLATMRAQTLAETPFEVVPPGLSLPLKLLIGAGALLGGTLARIAFRRWRTSQKQRRQRRLSQLDDLRVEPHTRPVEVSVEPEHDNTRTFTVRLEPHPDPGNQTVQEMNP
jgi:Bacterial Ig domain